MKLAIEHTTHFEFEEITRHSVQYLRLTPFDSGRQKVLNWSLSLPTDANEITDGYGNVMHVFTIDEPHSNFDITVSGEIEIMDDLLEDDDHELSPFVYLRQSDLTKPDKALRDYMTTSPQFTSTHDGLCGLINDLQTRLRKESTPNTDPSSAADAFAHLWGDSISATHVFLSCCRYTGVPARYVSGYLYSPDAKEMKSHQWAEAWLDDSWHTFDVQLGLTTPSRHLKLAVGLDHLDACPLRSVKSGHGTEAFSAIPNRRKTG